LCDCIPLCRWHYKLNAQSYHALGRRRFEQVHEISIREILERLHRRPQIRIQPVNSSQPSTGKTTG